jgi:hypothetical protein
MITAISETIFVVQAGCVHLMRPDPWVKTYFTLGTKFCGAGSTEK